MAYWICFADDLCTAVTVAALVGCIVTVLLTLISPTDFLVTWCVEYAC